MAGWGGGFNELHLELGNWSVLIVLVLKFHFSFLFRFGKSIMSLRLSYSLGCLFLFRYDFVLGAKQSFTFTSDFASRLKFNFSQC